MKLLIVAARFPEYGYKGDQLRTRQLIELLSPEHELQVITAGRPSGPEALAGLQRLARVMVVTARPIPRALSAMASLARGAPAQIGWMAPPRLRRAARRAAADSDAVIASTVRVVTGPLPAPLIIDHIDALSVNMGERAALERRLPLRLAAEVEAILLGHYERRAARWAAAQIAVSEVDTAALPQMPRPVVIEHLVAGGRTDMHADADTGSGADERDIDVIFTGNMNYPPNIEAARWLANAIVPELRKLRPNVRVVIAGRFASRLRLTGIEVSSDVPDLGVLLRRARVAVVPRRSGTGVPNKLLEAAAGGAAIVATRRAAASAQIEVLLADNAAEFATAVDRLLTDGAERRSLTASAYRDLERRAPTVIAAKLRAVLDHAVGEAVRGRS